MDYFNFRILKRIFYSKSFRKLLFSIFIFIVFIFIKNTCFGVFIFTENNTTYTFPDLPYSTIPITYEGYFMFYDSSNSRYYLIYTPKSSRVYFYASGNNTISPNSLVVSTKDSGLSNGTDNRRYYTSINGTTWTYQALQADNSGFWFSNFNSTNTGTRKIIYSTIPIYTSQNSSTIYFQTELFNQLPYFLNSAEDIAIGGQDLIIMPRRFSKQ